MYVCVCALVCVNAEFHTHEETMETPSCHTQMVGIHLYSLIPRLHPAFRSHAGKTDRKAG